MRKRLFYVIAILFCFVACEKPQDPQPGGGEGGGDIPSDTTTISDTIVFDAMGSVDGHEYVDLGLSVKWATCNLGATSSEQVGDYYAWQETTPWTTLTPINYMLYFNPVNPSTTILSSLYDAARMNWGKNWRMPTYDEQKELCDNCTWTYVNDFNGTGVSGCIIKSKKSSHAIFMPVTGYMNADTKKISEAERGHYWSSFGGPGDYWKGMLSVIELTFYEGLNFTYGGTWGSQRRYDGLPIRAVVGQAEEYIPEGPFHIDEAATASQGTSVSGEKDGFTYVDLGLPSRTLWATYNVGASKPLDYGNFYAWGETKTKNNYSLETYKFYDGTNGQFYRLSKYTWYQAHHGTIDGKFILEPEDDAATQNMSPNWCMPTKDQMQELCDYVQWQDTKSGSIKYRIGTSKTNGLTIIIPSAGWEYSNNPNSHMMAWYWSSELMGADRDGSDYYAYQLVDSPEGQGLDVHNTTRYQGLSVRGVVKK